MTRLVKATDKFVADNQDARMAAFAVLLVENTKENADKVAAYVKEQNISFPFTIAPEGSKGPGAYKISAEAAVTVLASKRNTVQAKVVLGEPAPKEEGAQAKEVEQLLAAAGKLVK